jgi:ribosomal protein S18 acetylase RimI-like enzyme
MSTISRPHTGVRVRTVRSAAEWRAAESLHSDHLRWLTAATGLRDVPDDGPRTVTERGGLATTYDRPGACLLFATVGWTAAGILGIVPFDEPDARSGTALLTRFWVDPWARGLGAGVALLRAADQAAASLGYQTLRLEAVPSVMRRAVGLYRGVGFSVVGHTTVGPLAGVVLARAVTQPDEAPAA